jgi:uncharacterized C2H2 Zn-finger protein
MAADDTGYTITSSSEMCDELRRPQKGISGHVNQSSLHQCRAKEIDNAHQTSRRWG